MKLSVRLLPVGLYVVKKCYLMLPGPLFFPTSHLYNSAVLTNRGWPHCVCRANGRGGKAALVKIAAAQNCGLNTMNPDEEGSC